MSILSLMLTCSLRGTFGIFDIVGLERYFAAWSNCKGLFGVPSKGALLDMALPTGIGSNTTAFAFADCTVRDARITPSGNADIGELIAVDVAIFKRSQALIFDEDTTLAAFK